MSCDHGDSNVWLLNFTSYVNHINDLKKKSNIEINVRDVDDSKVLEK